MEVKTTPPPINKPLMRDYLTKFRQRTYIVITFTQTTFILVAFGMLEFIGLIHLGWIGYFIISITSAVFLNILTIILVHVIGRPFRDLVQAIVLTAGEPTSLTPPNPNQPAYERDGFKDILLTVYQLAAQRDTVTNEPVTDSVNTTIADGLDNMSAGIIIIDKSGAVVYNNHRAPVRSDINGNVILDLIFPDGDTLDDWLAKNEKSKLTAEYQWTRVANKLPGEKDRRFFDITASYHKNSNAETVLTLFDRTKLYMPEEDELDFISFAAHELRGPITVIRGYLDVLEDELSSTLQPDQAELMKRLIVSSNRLTSYVNNILNASRYDRRHMKLHLSEETVRHAYDSISDDMQLRASAQNRLLVADIPDNLPTVAIDNNSVGEVLSNLIDNAIKYSNEGGLVHVVARTIPGFVEVSVVDRGIGMPTSVLPNLFHKFYRSHRSRETVAGTGIGLYICKAIVSSHGGTITARSTENEGSTFSFTLPIYDTVADKLKAGGNSNEVLIEHGSGWIKNHSMYRG